MIEGRSLTSAPTRVVVVDAHPLVRLGVRALLEGERDLVLAGEADPADAVRVARDAGADVVVVDVDVPGGDGPDLCRRLRGRDRGVEIVVLTACRQEETLAAALRGGVRGYVLKDAAPSFVLDAIRAAREGRAVVSPELTTTLVAEFAALGQAPPVPADPLAVLTGREREVLSVLGEGASNKEIAARLFITENTVKNHVHNILDKMGLTSRTEAALVLARTGHPGTAPRW